METVRIENAYKDHRFLPMVDNYTGSKTQSILCVPVPGFGGSRPIALIQVINKREGSHFNEDDEEMLTSLAHELSICLRMRAREIYALKTNIGHSFLENVSSTLLESSLLHDYGSTSYRYKYRIVADRLVRGTVIDTTIASMRYSHGQISPERLSESGGFFSPNEAEDAINNYDFDPFVVSDDRLIELALHMYLSYGLIDYFNIDLTILRRFLRVIQGSYHPENPYHNFKHAWSVMVRSPSLTL